MRGEISRPTRFPVVRAHDDRDGTASASGQRSSSHRARSRHARADALQRPQPVGVFLPIYTITGSCGQGAMNAVARRLDDAPAEARHGRNRAMGELARPDHAGMRTFVVLMTPSNELVSEHP
jgi:hypothetical protein